MWVLEEELKRELLSPEVVEMVFLSGFSPLFCQNEASLDVRGELFLNEMGRLRLSTPTDTE